MEIIRTILTDFWPVLVFTITVIFAAGKLGSKFEEKLKFYESSQVEMEKEIRERLANLETKVGSLDNANASTSATLASMLTQITSISSRMDTIIAHLWSKDK